MVSRQKSNTEHAFTIIELLVVIAIIGILASVVIQNVSEARPKAQEARALASLRSVHSVAVYCIQDGDNLNIPNTANPICAGQKDWPAIDGDGWAYGDAGACAFDGDVSDNTFMYCATNGTKIIQCTDGTCSVL
jgi:prepilin-type N-terminal cleavage/methylation domain-containing protein